MQGLDKSKDAILRAKSVVIASHINPDGDSIGSLLSLGLGLKKIGKKVYMICQDPIPKRYRFLPGANHIKTGIDKICDLAIAVDCSNKEVLGSSFDIIKKCRHILSIDHHEFRRPFSDTSFIDKKAASVGELIYLLLNKLNIKITTDIATNILSSVIVETNSFKLPTVNSSTFEVCSELLKKDINYYDLVDKVYRSINRESAVLSGICLSRCRFLKGGSVAWSIIKEKDFKRTKGRDEDVDPVADQIRSIKGVKVVVLFREKGKDYLRVSLRSKGKINVASIAELYKGGGHFDIAGCYIPNNPKSIKKFLRLAKDLVKAPRVRSERFTE